MPKSTDELLPVKTDIRLQIYAWSTREIKKFEGCLKIGQTTQDVNFRIKQSQGVAQVPYVLEVHESAVRSDGSVFRDSTVRERLKQKGFENVELEWMRCTATDVKTAIKELQTGEVRVGSHHEDFKMRAEQISAVKKTADYFNSIWAENKKSVPRFLWNAKMRFGKTFASYHLAKKLDAKKILVVTFKPAVEDAWQVDLETHVDFVGWQYFSKSSGGDPTYPEIREFDLNNVVFTIDNQSKGREEFLKDKRENTNSKNYYNTIIKAKKKSSITIE
jgi:hypothetical protein